MKMFLNHSTPVKKMRSRIPCEKVRCPLCESPNSRMTARGVDYEYQTSDQTFSFRKCLCCGHEYLNPRPCGNYIHMAYPPNYYTLEGRHTANQSRLISFLKKKVTGRRLNHIKEQLNVGSVFEVGCGDGSLLIDLKLNCPDLTVSGIDFQFSQETETLCRDTDVELHQGNIETFDFEGNQYDLIILNQLIEHVLDPLSVIKKLIKALKSGGYISIETPEKKGFDRSLFYDSYWGGYYFPRHLHLFGRESLTSLLERNGMTVIKSYSLVAPVIWAFSFHAMLCNNMVEGKKKRILRWFFSDKNPVCLGVFTLIDLSAILIGLRTSNQKIIARKL